jgi:pantoate--beta-alanine ligase
VTADPTERGLPVVVDRAALAQARAALPGRVGVVMTMGALHAGHEALLHRARSECDSVVVTVFVNPLQFGDAADLDRYPRTFDADVDVCRAAGADVVFAPAYDTVYPDGVPAVTVSSGELGRRLEGASRPGHFDGVLTVVAKLLSLVRPHRAYFGEKDAQQLALVRRMVRDLDLGAGGWGDPEAPAERGIEVVAVPTVRDADGLALSSRNSRLSPEERTAALALSRALRAGVARAADGAAAVLAAGRAELDAEPGVRTDYLELVDDVFDEARPGEPARLVVAASVGETRLIDNAPLTPGPAAPGPLRPGKG